MKKNVLYIYIYHDNTTDKKYFYKTFNQIIERGLNLSQDYFNEHKNVVDIVRDFDVTSYYEYVLENGSYINEYEFKPNEDITFIRGYGLTRECNFIIPKSKMLFWVETLEFMSKYIQNNTNCNSNDSSNNINFNVNIDYYGTSRAYGNQLNLISIYLTNADEDDENGTGAMEFEFIHNIIFQ